MSYEAIRALPEGLRWFALGNTWYLTDGELHSPDWLKASKCRGHYYCDKTVIDVMKAAAEAQALLQEYEALKERFEQVIKELKEIQEVFGDYALTPDNETCYLPDYCSSRAKELEAFLRELEGE